MRRWPWALVAVAGAAQAHTVSPLDHAPVGIASWNAEPWLLILLLASALLYAAGLHRLWQASAPGRGIRRHQLAAFAAGWVMLAVALVSPLDTLSEWLFSAHMVQHEMLMIVAAPLLVLGRPLSVWLWAFPTKGRQWLAGITRATADSLPWRLATQPLGAWTLHALALWLWHVPAWFDAALHHPALHALQHASFLFSALFFWWSVLGVEANSTRGWAMLSLFGTMLHTAALGILLTLSTVAWYPAYDHTLAFGMTALEDQQLGGLVMWVPAGLAYLTTGLRIAAGWLMRKPALL